MQENLIATVSSELNAPVSKVWNALVDPNEIKKWFFGTEVVTNWSVGSPILWRGEWQGKSYEDKGIIQKFEENRLLQFTHFSPLTGQPDIPENYHTVTIELVDQDDKTQVSLSQDKNTTEEERAHSEQNWSMVLAGLKSLLEGNN